LQHVDCFVVLRAGVVYAVDPNIGIDQNTSAAVTARKARGHVL
jgi:hypothetical protein